MKNFWNCFMFISVFKPYIGTIFIFCCIYKFLYFMIINISICPYDFVYKCWFKIICKIIHNRDKNAVQNMLNIVECIKKTSKRPEAFTRKIHSDVKQKS